MDLIMFYNLKINVYIDGIYIKHMLRCEYMIQMHVREEPRPRPRTPIYVHYDILFYQEASLAIIQHSLHALRVAAASQRKETQRRVCAKM
ncbi:hypothetical protein ACJX0J_035147, partial [Zea mays]